MKSNLVFRWIWRLNGVVIFLLGLGLCVLMAIAVAAALRDKFSSRNHDTVRLGPPEGSTARLQLSYGDFKKIAGTDFVISPLRSEQEFSNFGYGSMKEQRNSAVRNYLFVNVNSQEHRWLMPNNEVLFLSDEMIPAEMTGPKESSSVPVTAIYYRIVKTDSDEDGRLSAQDQKVFALSGPGGEDFTEVISNIDEILGTERTEIDSLLVFYRAGRGVFAALVKISEKKVISTKELPKINE